MAGKALTWLRDGAIMLGISVALLALLELGLRVYMGPPAFEFDSELIAALTPNASKIYLRSVDGGPRFVRWETNSEGFRGPPLLASPERRVIVYGDSNVQARFSMQEQTFTGQLQRLLRESTSRKVEVINAGVVGYGPDQNLIRLEKDVERYSPNLVVFHVFTENDFGDIVRNRLFELDADGELVPTGHEVTADARMPQSWWSRPTGELLSNSMISIFATTFMRARARAVDPRPVLDHDPEDFVEKRLRQHEREFEVYRAHAPRKYSMFSDHYEADIAFAPERESSRIKRALLKAVLARASAVAAERSIPFLVVIQPTSRDLTTNLPNHHETLAGVEGYDRRRLDRWVAELCDELGIEAVNLFDTFEAIGDDPNALYFAAPDPHWNEAGQLAAAEAVAPLIANALR